MYTATRLMRSTARGFQCLSDRSICKKVPFDTTRFGGQVRAGEYIGLQGKVSPICITGPHQGSIRIGVFCGLSSRLSLRRVGLGAAGFREARNLTGICA